jgi:hypothetical protein
MMKKANYLFLHEFQRITRITRIFFYLRLKEIRVIRKIR